MLRRKNDMNTERRVGRRKILAGAAVALAGGALFGYERFIRNTSYLSVMEGHTTEAFIYDKNRGIFAMLPAEDKTFDRQLVVKAGRAYITSRAGSSLEQKEQTLESILARTISYAPQVEMIAELLGYEVNHPFVAIGLGIMLIESGGVPDAKSKDNGMGLFQFTGGTPYDVLSHLQSDTTVPKENRNQAQALIEFVIDASGQYVTDKQGRKILELYSSKTNIELGMEYLNFLYSLFPERTLAVWAFNFGPGKVRDMIAA